MKLENLLELTNCPICEAILIEVEPYYSYENRSKVCKNDCFKLIECNDYRNHILYWFYVYDKVTVIAPDHSKDKDEYLEGQIAQIVQIIEYWKKDYRYLAEILTKD